MVWFFYYLFLFYLENYCFLVELVVMGWVIGGLVGIVFGRLNIFVVCLMGDGSFLMNG